MNIGIVGLGYWGPNLVRNFSLSDKIDKIFCYDQNKDRIKKVQKVFPNIWSVPDYESLLSSDLETVVIATPVHSHYLLAKEALKHHKHIWVEKPFTLNSIQAKKLIELAEKNEVNIFVDHTFIYTEAIQKIKSLIINNEIGDINYFDSVRINLGLFQHDINVIWDLAPHDISIMLYLLSKYKVEAISANGVANYSKQENIAQLCIYFSENCFGNINVNWTSPVKIRKILIGGSKKMLLFDDLENFEKIKVYDSGIEINSSESIHEALVQYRIGDMYSPKLKQTEALQSAVQEFVSSINEKRKPLTSGENGLKVVEILEATQLSLNSKGKKVLV
ncbi:MAG: Gfo/Idh/MocA family oxidoreductase [Ignavibacteriales bacterium]|nr:Gfo/Idh/MocA family oxidoreductase [Ignavibacteriales bacterium]